MSFSRLGFTFAASLLALPLLARPAHAESAVAQPNVFITAITVKEGDSGTTPFTTRVTLAQWHAPVTVEITALTDTASANDFSFQPVRLNLSPGVPQDVSGVINADIEYEGTERFQLHATIQAPSGGSYIASGGGQVLILDDDESRASRVLADPLDVREGDAGVSTAELQLRLEPAASHAVTVNYITRDGIARAGADFVQAEASVTFAPGEVTKAIPLQIVGDTEWELSESFNVILSSQRAVVPNQVVRITINNDDIGRDGGPIAPLPPDAGPPDAGPPGPTDGGPGASPDTAPLPSPDAARPIIDASSPPLATDSGCRYGGGSPGTAAAPLPLLLALVGWRVGRRRQR